jgi:hypothetical protein
MGHGPPKPGLLFPLVDSSGCCTGAADQYALCTCSVAGVTAPSGHYHLLPGADPVLGPCLSSTLCPYRPETDRVQKYI